MYRCDYCNTSTPARVPQTLVTLDSDIRNVTYTNTDAEGELKVTFGTEVKVELRQCPTCSGKPVPVPAVVDTGVTTALVRTLQSHARSCDGTKQVRNADGTKTKEPCPVCARNQKVYATVPAPQLSVALAEPRVHTGRLSIAALCVESMTRRSEDKNTVRSKADFFAAYGVLKAYEERGGGL